MPIIPALGRSRQENYYKFKVGDIYIARSARLHSETLSKKKKQKTKTKQKPSRNTQMSLLV